MVNNDCLMNAENLCEDEGGCKSSNKAALIAGTLSLTNNC